ARRDHRDADRVGDGAREREIETFARAVAVHAGEQDLARAQPLDLARPLDRVASGGPAPAVRVHLPAAARLRLRVDRADDALRAVARRRIGDQARVLHAGGVDRRLVGARVEQAADVLDRAHAAADGERNEHLRSDRLDDLQDEVALVTGRRGVVQLDPDGVLTVVPYVD